jgi:hypothetical protein
MICFSPQPRHIKASRIASSGTKADKCVPTRLGGFAHRHGKRPHQGRSMHASHQTRL